MPNLMPGGWRWRVLAGCNTVAAVLVLSWLWSPTRHVWDRLDVATFRWLNGSLALGHGWQMFWAYANWRPLDILPGLLLLLLFIYSQRRDNRARQLAGWTYLLLAALCLAAVKPAALYLVHDTLQYFRHSPTLVLDDSLRLSALVPQVSAKDSSPWCFPSDHGFVLLTITSLFWYLRRTRAAVMAVVITVVFSSPRMVSGGHWATDTLVGGAVMTLIGTSWLFATPLHYHLARIIYPIVRRCDVLLPPWKLPGSVAR